MPEWPIGTALKAVVDRNANRGFESRPLCAMTPFGSTTTYRLDRRFALQIFGWRMIFAGTFALLAFLLLSFDGFVLILGWICAVIAVLMLVGAIWAVARPPLVVGLDGQGFRLGRVAEGDIRRGHWTKVADVKTEQGSAGLCLVFSLESGQTGSVALMLLPRRAAELQRDVHERLNIAHGYRRIN